MSPSLSRRLGVTAQLALQPFLNESIKRRRSLHLYGKHLGEVEAATVHRRINSLRNINEFFTSSLPERKVSLRQWELEQHLPDKCAQVQIVIDHAE